VLDHQGVLQGYRGIAHDISERKRWKEALAAGAGDGGGET